MTNPADTRTGKPSTLSGAVLGLVSIMLSLLLLEGTVRWVFRSPYQWDHRLMFFSEDHNFRNAEWGGFTYQPNARVHSQTFYITNTEPPEVRLEYDYYFTANAEGLVQRNDVSDKKPAILFLGDSFTEGQGASPWFYEMERTWPQDAPHQIVNGGILGSGVEGWGRLYRQLSTKVLIEKAVLIFISEDWTRPVWQFPQQTVDCLKAAVACIGNEDFYGLPADSVEARAQIDRIARYRIDYLSKFRSANVFARSAVHRRLVAPAFRRLAAFRRTGSLRGQASRQFEISKQIATGIVSELGRDNVLFMYLPQKTELASGPSRFGRKANDFIRESGFSLVDGRTVCGLSLGDYHKNDGHPNAMGYAKIRACVERTVGTALHLSGGATP